MGALTAPAIARGDDAISGTASVGLDLGYIDYKEELTPPRKSTESGPILAVQGSFELHVSPTLPWMSLFATYSASSTHFDGTTNEPVVPTTGTTGNQYFKIEGRVGYPITSFLDVYAGLGYRSWLRRLDYDEFYSWKFAIVGLRASTDYGVLLPDLRLRVDGSLRPTFGASMRLEDYAPNVQPATLDLQSRLGVRIETPIDYRFSPIFFASLTPYYEFSALGASDYQTLHYTDGSVYKIAREPSSTTNQYGATASFSYSY